MGEIGRISRELDWKMEISTLVRERALKCVSVNDSGSFVEGEGHVARWDWRGVILKRLSRAESCGDTALGDNPVGSVGDDTFFFCFNLLHTFYYFISQIESLGKINLDFTSI